MQMGISRRTEIAGLHSRVQQGFTLIEIMVVIAILAILAALMVQKIMSSPDEAKRITAKQDIGTVTQALTLYRRNNGRYPTQEQGLRALIEKPATDPVPNNPPASEYLSLH